MSEYYRQLAAIMFTDLVGYTALMGADEEKAFELLKKNRLVQRPIIEKYNGRWLKEMGDGVLASFNAVSDAVYCAGAIQKACENEPDLTLRIGIHIGEVVFEGEDVFGDGVNIASRLESLAPHGGILVSESVHKNMLNKKGIETKFVREEILKNVKDPVRIYEVKVDGIETPSGSITHPPLNKYKGGFNKKLLIGAGVIMVLTLFIIYQYGMKDRLLNTQTAMEAELDISIAVLPFVNLSGDSELDPFCDGMTDEVISKLSKIRSIGKVISRTTVMNYKVTNKTIPEIAKELGVNHILESSFQKSGDRVRINLQLINAPIDDHIWSDDYSGEWGDIFQIQAEVAENVARNIGAAITITEIESIRNIPTSSMNAYDLFINAKYENKKFSKESFYNSIELLKESVKIDSQFYQAYTLMAWNYTLLGIIFGDLHPNDARKHALAAIEKSLKIKSDFLDSYLVLGGIQYLLEWQFDEAEKSFRKSLELEFHNFSITNYCFCTYTLFLTQSGRFDEVLELVEQIIKIDPLYTYMHTDLGNIYFLRDQKDQAINALQKSISYNQVGKASLSRVYLHYSEYRNVIEILEPWLAKNQMRAPLHLAYLALAHYHLNERKQSDIIIDELLDRKSKGDKEINYALAFYNAGIGEDETALDYLEQAFESHDVELLWMNVDPQFYHLRSDFRFQDLLKRVGFDVSG